MPSWWLAAYTIYLVCATTVHPWYLCLPILFSALSRWRFPLFWSFMVVLTYTNYTRFPYQENLYLLAAEYCGVFLYAAWELRRKLAKS
ncbi:MAG: hypothetical protein HC821_02750 [Lewinella sp.]|nr:hypothetical protein [Lewinella sp.]